MRPTWQKNGLTFIGNRVIGLQRLKQIIIIFQENLKLLTYFHQRLIYNNLYIAKGSGGVQDV